MSIYILSGKYGLLNLQTIIDPYDYTLSKKPVKVLKEWAFMVNEQLLQNHITEAGIFCPKNYYQFLNIKKYIFFKEMQMGPIKSWAFMYNKNKNQFKGLNL